MIIKFLIGLCLFSHSLNAQWVRQSLPPNPDSDYLVDVHFMNKDLGFICGWGGAMFKTTDGGEHWIDHYTGIRETFLSVFTVSPETVYVGRSGLYRSDDGGYSWSDLGFTPTDAIKSIQFQNAWVGYITKGERVLKTIDGGETWDIKHSGFIERLQFTSDSIGYVWGGITFEPGSFGEIYKTIDAGNTWDLLSISTGISEIKAAHFVNDTTGFFITFLGELFKTTDGGISWNITNNGISTATFTDCWFLNDSTGYATCYFGYNNISHILKTTNDGVSWSIDFADSSNSAFFAIHFPDTSTGYVVGKHGVILKHPSSSLITTRYYPVANGWNLVSVPLIVNDYSTSGLYPTAISNAFAYKGGYVPKESLATGAGYWIKFNGPGIIPFTGLPRTEDTVEVVSKWNLIGSPSSPVQVSSIGSIPPGLIVSEFYQYNSENGSYEVANTLEPGKAYMVKSSQNGQLVLSSSPVISQSNRIKIAATTEFPPPPPEGNSSPVTTLPSQFSLEQNHPNPFNPVTRIRYQLPIRSHVKLTVFDVMGRAVMTLVDEEQEAGYKSFLFDAYGLANGVYFYRLHASNFVVTKKLMLLK